MTPLSDRQQDSFDNPAKMACRQGNLRVLREAAFLLWEDGGRTFRQQRPDLKWVPGNLYERLDAPELARVGILNLDEYGEVGNRSAEADFALIRGMAHRERASFSL